MHREAIAVARCTNALLRLYQGSIKALSRLSPAVPALAAGLAAGSPSKLVVLKYYKIQISGTEVLHHFREAASGDLGWGGKALGCPLFFPGNGRGQS
jgi:hypothetical protein